MIRKLSCWVVCVCGVGMLAGCGNDPWVIYRDVAVAGNASANNLNANSADIGGVTIDENGNVIIPGNLDVGGNSHTGGDSTTDGTITGQEVVDFPEPPPPVPVPPAPVCGNWVIEDGEQCDRANFGSHTCLGYDGFVGGHLVCTANCKINFNQCTRPPPPPPPPTALTVTLLAPFIGLAQEGNPPVSCTTFTVGTFNVKVRINIEGGVGPYIVQFQNYYGSVEFGDIDEEGEFILFFDAQTTTTECVSSLFRVTDANGEKKVIFFYIRVR